MDDLVRVALEIESYALSVGDLPRRLDAFWYHTWVLGQRGRATEAIELLQSIDGEATTPINRAQFLHCMSQSLRRAGDLDGALAHSNEALAVTDQVDVDRGDIVRASTIFELGKIARDSEDWDTAERYFQEAAAVFNLDQVAQSLDDAEDPSEAKVFAFSLDRALGLLGNLGYVQYRRGNHRAALDPLRRSLMYFREHGSLSNIVTSVLRLAAVELALGLPEATAHLTEAKQGATKLGLLVELTWITQLEEGLEGQRLRRGEQPADQPGRL